MTKTSILLLGSLFAFGSLTALGCSDDTTGDTSSTSSSSSSSSSGEGGTGGMGTGGAGGGMSAAAKYCADIMTNCTAANAQWPDAKSCENAAAAYPAGTSADTSGDTLGCRTYHAGAAKADATLHCPHAGPSGDGACGMTCEGFCDVAVATCKTEWPDKTACMTACALIPTAGMGKHYNTSYTGGNTLECRLYHLSVAATDAASATMHCPHTKAVTAMGDPCF